MTTFTCGDICLNRAGWETGVKEGWFKLPKGKENITYDEWLEIIGWDKDTPPTTTDLFPPTEESPELYLNPYLRPEVSEELANFTPKMRDGELMFLKKSDYGRPHILLGKVEYDWIEDSIKEYQEENEELEKENKELEKQRADAWVERRVWKDLYHELQEQVKQASKEIGYDYIEETGEFIKINK